MTEPNTYTDIHSYTCIHIYMLIEINTISTLFKHLLSILCKHVDIALSSVETIQMRDAVSKSYATLKSLMILGFFNLVC